MNDNNIFNIKAISVLIKGSKLKSLYHRLFRTANGDKTQLDEQTIDKVIEIVKTGAAVFVLKLEDLKKEVIAKKKQAVKKAA